MLFFTKLRRTVTYYEEFHIARALEAQLEENRLRKFLEFWQVQLHLDPQTT